MSRQINLYNPALLPKVDLLSGRMVLQAYGAAVLVALLALAWSTLDAKRLAAEEQTRQAQLAVLQNEIAQLTQTVAGRKPDAKLSAELDSLESLLAGRAEVMAVLKSGALGDTKGVSEYFRAFARQTLDGVWLTGFSVALAGQDITIDGRALRAELVSGYLGKLRSEDVLRGHGFGSLSVRQPTEAVSSAATVQAATAPAQPAAVKPSGFLEFHLASHAPAETVASAPGGAR